MLKSKYLLHSEIWNPLWRRTFQSAPLWIPSVKRSQSTRLFEFLKHIEQRHNLQFSEWDELHKWSISHTPLFWREIWDFCGVLNGTCPAPWYKPATNIRDAVFFPNAQFNFAENLLRSCSHVPHHTAVTFWGESTLLESLTYQELYSRVSLLTEALKNDGLQEGDRVIAVGANCPDMLVAMLATTALGAIWSCCSPDFGHQALVDRFGQIDPKILFYSSSYLHKGKEIDCHANIKMMDQKIPSLKRIICMPYPGKMETHTPPYVVELHTYTLGITPRLIPFVPINFNAPLFILFSSGTTSLPKCIVHRNGSLLQLMKEHQLHMDIGANDKVLYYTRCAWMMWHWLVTSLASGASIVLFDGSPLYPTPRALLDITEQEKVTFLGVSPKLIAMWRSHGVECIKSKSFESLKTIGSTGSPLSAEYFSYIYNAIKNDLHLVSLSGGTDIISCFVLGNPMSPVWAGEIQAKGLGMDVDVFDENGQSNTGNKGELVCKNSFVSQPIGFWNDPDKKLYTASYYQTFPGVWAQGDFSEITENKGIIIHGRSDTVLNPGGVRIGTSEIYRQLESIEEIEDSVVIGRQTEDDMDVLLFVQLRAGIMLEPELNNKIKSTLKKNASHWHVPKSIYQVSAVPRTKTGKLAEAAVRDVVHGKPVKNYASLGNPECLEEYKKFCTIQQKCKL